jgi:hypothetical protein
VTDRNRDGPPAPAGEANTGPDRAGAGQLQPVRQRRPNLRDHRHQPASRAGARLVCMVWRNTMAAARSVAAIFPRFGCPSRLGYPAGTRDSWR